MARVSAFFTFCKDMINASTFLNESTWALHSFMSANGSETVLSVILCAHKRCFALTPVSIDSIGAVCIDGMCALLGSAKTSVTVLIAVRSVDSILVANFVPAFDSTAAVAAAFFASAAALLASRLASAA